MSPDTVITVKYSSDDRVDISENVADMSNIYYDQLVDALREKGLTKIEVVPQTTELLSQNQKVSRIFIDDEEYLSGACYPRELASIRVEYYDLQIRIGQTAEQFENAKYTEIVDQLQSMGFTNIRLLRANDLNWLNYRGKEGEIKKITINGAEDFKESDVFDYDSEITIIVHTRTNKGCKDITEIAE